MQTAQNTFNGGLLMDLNPMTVPNSVLTDCLNGTLITFNGNEFVLQNDMGNGRVETCRLKKDYIPLGMKEYGGVIYIVSQNPFTGDCEIGSFPSPERIITDDELGVDGETILKSSDFYENIGEATNKGITNPYLKLDLGNILLRPGDKFLVYVKNDDSSLKNFEDLVTTTDKTENKLLSVHLARVTEQGLVNNIDTVVTQHDNTRNRFYYTEPQYNNLVKNSDTDDFYTVYSDRLNGYLAIVVEVIQDINYSVDIDNIKKNGNTFEFTAKIKSIADHLNNAVGVKVIFKEGNTNIKPTLDPAGTWNDEDKFFDIPFSIGSNTLNIVVSDLDLDKTYIMEITPYSKYQWFENLKYTLSVDYTSLTTNKSSSIWRYKTSEYVDENQDPYRATTLTFDLFLRGSLNGKNRPSVVYLELYDIVSDASLIYPLDRVVSGLNTIQIPHFYKSGGSGSTFAPYYEWGSEEYIGDSLTYDDIYQARLRLDSEIIPQANNHYYILLDSSKKSIYIKARQYYGKPNIVPLSDKERLLLKLGPSDNLTGLDILNRLCILTFSQGPCCIKVRPELTERYRADSVTSYIYNNTRLYDNEADGISRNNRLRDNNLYICRICALDINKSEGTELGTEAEKDYRCVEYNVYNLLWTNGIYNTREGDNFNTNYSQDSSYIKVIAKQNTEPTTHDKNVIETREGYIDQPVSMTEGPTEFKYSCKYSKITRIVLDLYRQNYLRYGISDNISINVSKDISDTEVIVKESEQPLLSTDSEAIVQDVVVKDNSLYVDVYNSSIRGIVSQVTSQTKKVNQKQWNQFGEYRNSRKLYGIMSYTSDFLGIYIQSIAHLTEGVWLGNFITIPSYNSEYVDVKYKVGLKGKSATQIMNEVQSGISSFGAMGIACICTLRGGDTCHSSRIILSRPPSITEAIPIDFTQQQIAIKDTPTRRYLYIFLCSKNNLGFSRAVPDYWGSQSLKNIEKTAAILPIAIKINADADSHGNINCHPNRHLAVQKVFNEFLDNTTYVMDSIPIDVDVFVPSDISKSKKFNSKFVITSNYANITASGNLMTKCNNTTLIINKTTFSEWIKKSNRQYITNIDTISTVKHEYEYYQNYSNYLKGTFNTDISHAEFDRYISDEYEKFVLAADKNTSASIQLEDLYKDIDIGTYAVKDVNEYILIGKFKNNSLELDYSPSSTAYMNMVSEYISAATGDDDKYNYYERPMLIIARDHNKFTSVLKDYFISRSDALEGAEIVNIEEARHTDSMNCNS